MGPSTGPRVRAFSSILTANHSESTLQQVKESRTAERNPEKSTYMRKANLQEGGFRLHKGIRV